MKTDTLNRRSRFAPPQPTATGLFLTDRDYAILHALDRHGELPTNYLYELTKHFGKDLPFFKKRLTLLFNGYCEHPSHRSAHPEKHVCHARHFIDRHRDQFLNFRARYQSAVYHLSKFGRLVVEERGSEPYISRSGSFTHDYFSGCITASFEALAAPHRFLSRKDIIDHPSCPEGTRRNHAPFDIPVSDLEARSITPDDVFGIAYEPSGYRFFALEADRGSERINTLKPSSSIAKKVRLYQKVFKDQTHFTHLGIRNLTALFATTSQERIQTMIAYVKENVDERFHSRFLFKYFSDFGEIWSIPKDFLPVFGPWQSASGNVDLSQK